MINYTKAAAGQAQNKEHWVSMIEGSWFVLGQEVSAQKDVDKTED